MNRSLLFGFLGGALFVAGLFAGAAITDRAIDAGDGALEIPGTMDERIPVVPDGEAIDDPDAGPGTTDDAYLETEVAGEFASLDRESPASATGGYDRPDAEIPATGGPDSGDDAPSYPDRSIPWEVDPLLFTYEELVFPDAGFGLLRWLDFCAENPGAPSCPDGVGGTVLAPLDDTLAVGDFLLRDLYTTGAPWTACEPPADLLETQYLIAILVTHPARLEIDYHPIDDPAAVRSVVVDHTDPSGAAFRDFADDVTTNGFSYGVSHCFVLDSGRARQLFQVNVRATSFTGETDEGSFRFESQDRRGRPPISLDPNGDYQVVVAVPVKTDPEQQTRLVLLPSDEGLECDDGLRNRGVLPAAPGRQGSFYVGRLGQPRAVIESPDYRYDATYDAVDYWTLNLEEGSRYRMCVWWLESEGVRSFDPSTRAIVERESRWIYTPDRLQTRIAVVRVAAPSEDGLDIGEFTLRSICGGPRGHYMPALRLPRVSLAPNQVSPDTDETLCDYQGHAQPTHTSIEARFADGSVKTFLIRTPNTGPLVRTPFTDPINTRRVELDLTREGGGGLCGGSFGDCDPPTSTIPGPRVTLLIEMVEGNTNGQSGWLLGLPSAFAATPEEPTDLPVEIRIDEDGSGVGPPPRGGLALPRDRLVGTATFDRPVSLRAFVDGDPGTQCFTGPPTEYTSDGMRATHGFTLSGLCADTSYDIGLEATDAAGTTTRFSYTPFPIGSAYWPGRGTTNGYGVSFSIEIPDQPSLLNGRAGLEVVIDGRRFNLTGDNYCLGQETGPHRDTWGDPVEIEIHVRASSGTGRLFEDFFCESVTPYEGSVVARISMEDLLSDPEAVGPAATTRIVVPLHPVGGAPAPEESIVVRIITVLDYP